jgi:hypothetical protein
MFETLFQMRREGGNVFRWGRPNGRRRTAILVTTALCPQTLGAKQVASLNKEILDAIMAQSPDHWDERLAQFVQYAKVRAAAVNQLDIYLRLSPEATLELKAEGGFSHEQLNVIRRMGVKMASFDEIAEQEEKVLFEHEICRMPLCVGSIKTGSPPLFFGTQRS